MKCTNWRTELQKLRAFSRHHHRQYHQQHQYHPLTVRQRIHRRSSFLKRNEERPSNIHRIHRIHRSYRVCNFMNLQLLHLLIQSNVRFVTWFSRQATTWRWNNMFAVYMGINSYSQSKCACNLNFTKTSSFGCHNFAFWPINSHVFHLICIQFFCFLVHFLFLFSIRKKLESSSYYSAHRKPNDRVLTVLKNSVWNCKINFAFTSRVISLYICLILFLSFLYT